MRALDTRWAWVGVALAAAVATGGCGSLGKLASATTPHTRLSPLVRSIEAYVHAISVQSVRCGAPGNHGRKSCVVEFTDSYGQWFATLIARGSRIIADPGGVSDWLCNGACANPPPMTGNTGKKGFNTGTGNTGPTGVTGIGITGVTGGNGVVSGSGNGVVSGSGNGVVSGAGTGVVPGTGNGVAQPGTGSNTGTVTGSNGVVYPPGSTGPGAPTRATPGG